MNTNLIRRFDGWDVLSPSLFRDLVAAEEAKPTGLMVTVGMIRDGIGLTQEQYGLVRGTLDRAIATLKADELDVKRLEGLDMEDALIGMLGRGVDLSIGNRQVALDRLATFGQWPDALRDKIKSLGLVVATKWEHETGTALPTLEWFTDAKAAELAKDAEQAAAENRRKAYADLRDQVQSLYGQALRTLVESEASNAEPPTIAELFGVAD